MNADALNRWGLLIGAISGLLLIPEVLNLLPIDRFEDYLERLLPRISQSTYYPTKYHPLMWRFLFSEANRLNAVEALTAIITLISSIIWLGALMVGIIVQSRFLVIFALMPVGLIIIRRIISYWNLPAFSSASGRLKLLGVGIFAVIAAGPISVIRVGLIVLRFGVNRIQPIFERHDVVRVLLTVLAILMFVLSQLLQFVATYI